MTPPPHKTRIKDLNRMTAGEFVRTVGHVFENSPWVAERAFEAHPFEGITDLHEKMVAAVTSASEAEQLALIRAHPDLVGRLAAQAAQPAQHLTPESRREQAAAGLDRLSADEVEAFRTYNAAYHRQFSFPFVICARENKKDAILAAFPQRLRNSREQEMAAALAEIAKIARLRLLDIIEEH